MFEQPDLGWSSIAAIAGFLISMWLGCYMATHARRSRTALLATLAILSLAGYFLHAVLCLHVPAVQAGFLWRRFLGWFAIPPLPLWLHLTTELLPPDWAPRQRYFTLGAYAVSLVLAALWLFGSWTFSTVMLVPLELAAPLGVFGVVVTAIALVNLWRSQQAVRDPILRRRRQLLWFSTFLAAVGGVYIPVFAGWWTLPLMPTTTLALGEGILSLALVLLGYTVVRHNTFMAGRWIGRDFAYHVFSIAAVAGVYVLAIAGAWFLAMALNFNVLALIIVIVTGLVIATHLLVDWARNLWDAVFFRELRPLRVEMRSLAQEVARPVQPEQEMQHAVEGLAHLTGSALVCVVIDEGRGLVVRAATRSGYVGQAMDAHQLEEEFAHKEPLCVFEKQVGYLLLSEKGVGEGYDRQERMWISALAVHLSALLGQAALREEATQQLATIAHEIKEIQSREADLQQEMQRVLAGGEVTLNRHELYEALRCRGDVVRLADLINREGSTLATLPPVAHAGSRRAQVLFQVLCSAVEALRPMESLPSLEMLKTRAVRLKRRRHMPASVADYYTLRLLMDGYTQEAIAEEMEISPRQVRNYLDRAISRLVTHLEVH